MRRIVLFFFVAFLSVTGHATTCGNTSAPAGHTTSASGITAMSNASRCTPASNSTVTDCKVQTGVTGGNVQCGIYDSDGSAGNPKTLLCQGTPVASVANNYVTITLSGCPTLTAGHIYYVAHMPSNSTVSFGTTGGGVSYTHSQTYPTMATFSFAQTGTTTYPDYLDITAASTSSVPRHPAYIK